MLHRRNLSVLFEDEKGSSSAFENGEILEEEEKEVKKKVMPWAQKNQQKKVKKASKKPSSGGNKKPVKKDEPAKMKTKEAVERGFSRAKVRCLIPFTALTTRWISKSTGGLTSRIGRISCYSRLRTM